MSSIVSGTTTEYVFNANGKRVSEWNGSGHAQLKGKYYWGGQPVAYYVPSSAAHFEHQDWLGTERVRTSYNGSVENSYTSLPFGDAQTPAANGTDANHFAALDHDAESYTDHAQFRQYSNTQGRWLSPDPYAGSYDFSNPQSLNRYVYALNNPLGLIDPSGLDYCSISSLNSPDPYYNQYGEEEDLNDQASCEAAGGQWFVTNPATPCPDGQAPDENGNCYTVNPDGSISGGSISAYVDGDDGSFTIVAGIVTYQPGDPVGVGGGSFGTAPNNQKGCSVLDPNCKKPGPVANYLSFLACEYNDTIEQITDQEDGQGTNTPSATPAAKLTTIPLLVYGIVGPTKPWVKVTSTATLSSIMIGTAVHANEACSPSFFGN